MPALIEGRHAVLEALRSGVPVERIYVSTGTHLEDTMPEIATLAASGGVSVEAVSRRWLDERSERGAHQGVMAAVSPFVFTPLAQVLRNASKKDRSLLIALDHVTDAGNLGAIARSAEVVGADGLIVTKRRSAPIATGAYKSSAGALAWLPVAQEPNLARALDACKDSGYWIVGASEDASETLWDTPVEGRLVLVFGGEEEGLSRLTAEKCDFLAALPVLGHVESLNVAQTAAVYCFEWLRRNREST